MTISPESDNIDPRSEYASRRMRMKPLLIGRDCVVSGSECLAPAGRAPSLFPGDPKGPELTE